MCCDGSGVFAARHSDPATTEEAEDTARAACFLSNPLIGYPLLGQITRDVDG